MIRIYYLMFLTFLIGISSCYKSDYTPVFDPNATVSIYQNNIQLGSDYSTQVYYDLENKTIFTSKIADWDIAVSLDSNNLMIKWNSANEWSIANCNTTDFNVNIDPQKYESKWKVDDPSGIPEVTVIGRLTNNFTEAQKVFLLKYSHPNMPIKYYKFQLLSLNKLTYSFRFQNLNNNFYTEQYNLVPSVINSHFYYGKFKFENDTMYKANMIEPDFSMGYDILFTRYAKYFPDFNLNYIVTGVLLNPKNTKAYLDSITNYENFLIENVDTSRFTSQGDIIGWNWKYQESFSSSYIIKKNYTYIIKTSSGYIYKLRFLDFYNDQREKGNPSFEYLRIK